MSFNSLVRSVVKTADNITKSLQVEVTHTPWIAQNAKGTPTYGSPVKRLGIVDRKGDAVETDSGEVIQTVAYVMFPRPIAPNGAAGRHEPIDNRDIITLPDGFSGPIAKVAGVADPTTGRGYYVELWLAEKYQGRG